MWENVNRIHFSDLLTHFWIRAQFYEPESVKLFESRGYQTNSHKFFMRTTVIVSDLIFLFPAVYFFVSVYYKDRIYQDTVAALFFILIQPGLILIDHGHFQYNGVSLGLTIFAIAFILNDNDLIGSIFYVLSLNFKQMSLYYSPAIFFYLLGKNLDRSNMGKSIAKIAFIGLTVVGTFAIIWSPFLFNYDDAIVVFKRLFPVHRGLYEDKVANFWCSISPIFKVRNFFETDQILKLCTASTLIAFIPSCIITLTNPTKKNFILSTILSSFSFFFFSYHTHEKSILLPMTVLSLLIVDHPYIVSWATMISCFSMYPLLVRDGQGIPYAVLSILYLIFSKENFKNQLRTWIYIIGFLEVLLHILEFIVPPPARYPDIFVLGITSFSFANFFLIFLLMYSEHFFETITRERKGIKED